MSCGPSTLRTTTPSLTEVLEQAQIAVYVEAWSRVICDHCFKVKSEHAEGKCLFESTSFKPCGYAKLRSFATSHFNRAQDMIRYIKSVLTREGAEVVVGREHDGDGFSDPADRVPKT